MSEEAVQTQEVQSQEPVVDDVEQGLSDIVQDIEGDKEETELNEDSLDDSEQAKQEAKDEAIKELRKKLKLKVNGKEIEKEIDWNDEDSIKRELQKAIAFDHTSQEHATLKKQVETFFQRLQSNPFEILQEMGYNLDDLSEKHIQQKIEEMKKSPEQIERENMEKELARLKSEKEQIEQQAREAELEKRKNQSAAQIEHDILSALKSETSTLPQSPLVIKRIAENMLLAMKRGYKDVTASEMIPLVEKQFKGELQEMFGKMPEEILEAVIGKNNLDRIRKKRLNSRKQTTKTARQIAQDSGNKGGQEQKEEKKQTFKEFFDLRS